MENKKELKLGYKIALIICSVLALADLVVRVIEMISGADIVMPIISLLVMIVALYYALVGYKKPHGNLLRNVFFINALLGATFIVFAAPNAPQYIIAVNIFSVVLRAFMAGRLNKFKQNIAVIIIVAICTLIFGISFLMNASQNTAFIISLFQAFAPFIGWATLSVAYLSRYDAHVEAGLEDKN